MAFYAILDSFPFKLSFGWTFFDVPFKNYGISKIHNFFLKNCFTILIRHWMADSPQKAVKFYVILDSFSFKMCPEWIIFSHFVRCYNISNIDNFIFKNCLTYLICHRLGNDSLTKWWTLCYFRLFHLWNALYKIISIFANVVIFLRNWKNILCQETSYLYMYYTVEHDWKRLHIYVSFVFGSMKL